MSQPLSVPCSRDQFPKPHRNRRISNSVFVQLTNSIPSGFVRHHPPLGDRRNYDRHDRNSQPTSHQQNHKRKTKSWLRVVPPRPNSTIVKFHAAIISLTPRQGTLEFGRGIGECHAAIITLVSPFSIGSIREILFLFKLWYASFY